MLISRKRSFVAGVVTLGLACPVAGGCGSDQTIVGSVDASKVGGAAATTAPPAGARAPKPAAAQFRGIGNKGNPE